MAIDTRDKRASTVAGLLSILAVAAVPNGDIDAGDRQQITGVYRGIAAGEPFVPGEENPSWVLPGRIDPGPDVTVARIDSDILTLRTRMRRVS